MSVLIEGLEMPRVCVTEHGWYGYCPMDRIWCAQRFAPPDHTVRQIQEDQTGNLPSWCPLRALPEKHGRLVDADALHSLYERRWHELQILNWDENPTAEPRQAGINWCINTLHNDAPTIVEAED